MPEASDAFIFLPLSEVRLRILATESMTRIFIEQVAKELGNLF